MAPQRDPPSEPRATRAPITDSPWLWATVFCAAGVMFLLVIGSQYAARQRRLEMQYLARKEIVRRQAEGEAAASATGRQGDVAPPAVGELMIPIWPLVVALGALFVVSAFVFWRGRRSASRAASSKQEEPA